MDINQIHNGIGDNVAGNKIVINEKPERHINDDLRNQIISSFPTDAGIDIRYLIGDNEVFTFTSEIKSFLEEKGFKINSFLSALYNPPLVGQFFDPVNKNVDGFYELKIGSSN